MKFILLGFEFESSNKGCEALSYAVISFLNSVEEFEPLEIVNINIHDSMGKIPEIYSNIQFKNIRMRIKRPTFWRQIKKELHNTDAILDITHGDSFSDIYGEEWFRTTTIVKSFFVLHKTPFILMPQTYGPYKKNWAKKWAKWVINKADKVYTRDNISGNFLKELGIKNDFFNTIDMAFLLPFNKEEKKDDLIRVGINISGLLWNDCLHEKKFQLSTDYCEYSREIIKRFYNNPHYEILFVPHVICDPREGEDFFENDCKAIRQLLKEFPKCIFRNDFETALDVKNYIANVDVLIAARMHASIAAFSSNVPVIPFAYSRKFEGVYNDLNYPYVIDGTKMSTVDSIEKTVEFIQSYGELRNEQNKGLKTICDAQKAFSTDFLGFVLSHRAKNRRR